MSFFGKTYKRVKVENMVELMDAMNVSETLRSTLKSSSGNSTSTFTKNDDGSLQYKMTAGGQTMMDLRIPLGVEFEMPLPDKSTGKTTFALEGDKLKAKVGLSDGRHVFIDRIFEGNTMRTEIYSHGTVTAVMHSEVV